MRVYRGGENSRLPEYFLKIVDGKISNKDGYITVDNKIGKEVQYISDLIYNVYPTIEKSLLKLYQWLRERAIKTPRNSSATEINNIILKKLQGEVKV